MKKVKTYKGYVIALKEEGYYNVYTADEWAYGEGLRYAEYKGMGSIKECIENIDY